MLRSKARWKVSGGDRIAEDAFIQQLKLPPVIARMLATRGICDIGEAERFLYGGKDHFHDPFLLDGMESAVSRIRRALESKEKIRVYGDYDADGVSSTALMVHLLRRLGADFDTYIPHRANEGYGLNLPAIDLAKESGISLMITVDTGISAAEQVAYAAGLGIDVIVTDHHEPPEHLPEAIAVINPKKPGCPYPFKQLAGVGVAFKLAHALLGELPEQLLEIASIGTVADLMPLIDENRYIVKLGLERMQASGFTGIRALLNVSGVSDKEVTAGHLGFSLAPRINASGRLDHAGDAVTLLTTEDTAEAERIAASLDELNKERQRIVDEMTKEAMGLIACNDPAGANKVIIVAAEGWNVGVIGIVAAKVLERFYRPVIVLSIDSATGMAKGSARSIPGYDMYKALTHCADLLEHYGGHQAAAGMTIHRSRIDDFQVRLNGLADEWLEEEQLVPLYTADAEVELSDVTVESIRQIESLAPFGMGNPAPRFIVSGLTVQEKRKLGRDGQHMKLLVQQSDGEAIEALGFGRGSLLELLSGTAAVDLLGELGINEWNGVRKPQIVIQDLRIPNVQVFDWRGVKKGLEKFREVQETLAAANGKLALERTAIVVEAGSPTSAYDPDRLECGLWAMDHRLGVTPLNEIARNASFSDAEDVLLVSLPNRIDSLEEALARCSGQRIYALFADWDRDYAAMPSREAFKALYQLLMQQRTWDKGRLQFAEPVRRKAGLSESLLHFMLDVFEELEFVEKNGETYAVAQKPRKRELTEARAYQARLQRTEVEQVLIYSNAQQLSDWISGRLAGHSNIMMEVTG